MLKKYWVTKGLEEYLVIKDSFDPIGGNSYETAKGNFQTELEANEYADKLNKEFELECDTEDALGYHDPSERMEELGYVFVDKKWIKNN